MLCKLTFQSHRDGISLLHTIIARQVVMNDHDHVDLRHQEEDSKGKVPNGERP